MPLRHLKWPQNAGAIGAPLGGNRANPGKHPRGNSGAISGAIGEPPGGNWDPPIFPVSVCCVQASYTHVEAGVSHRFGQLRLSVVGFFVHGLADFF